MVNIFGGGETKPTLTAFSEASFSDGDRFALREHIGAVLLITVYGPQMVNTSYGEKKAVKVDVQTLDGRTYKDALIFNSAPVSQLDAHAGQTIAVKVEEYKSNQGTMAPKFGTPSAEELKAAEAVISQPPF